jgi:hypothetical protein
MSMAQDFMLMHLLLLHGKWHGSAAGVNNFVMSDFCVSALFYAHKSPLLKQEAELIKNYAKH